MADRFKLYDKVDMMPIFGRYGDAEAAPDAKGGLVTLTSKYPFT